MKRRSPDREEPTIASPSWQPPATAIACLLLVAATAIVFGQVAGHEILDWDDHQHLTHNPHLDPVSWHGIGELWSEPYFGMYVPLTYTYYAALAWTSGGPFSSWTSGYLDPTIFHVGSLALHIGCTLVAFALLNRLVRDPLAAGIGAALFALHPLQVEAIAWVSEARGLLSALLGMMAVWLLALTMPGKAGEHSEAEGPGRSTWILFGLGTLLFAGSLLAKPSAVTIPLIACVLLFGWFGHISRTMIATLALWLVMALGLTAVTLSQQPESALKYVPTLVERPIVVGYTLTFYAFKCVWPFELAPAYGHSAESVIKSSGAESFILVPFFVAGMLWFTWRNKRWRPVGVAICISLLAMVPVSGVIPFNYQNISTVADRYLYVAMLGPALIVAWLLSLRHAWKPGTQKLAIGSCMVVLGMLSVQSYRQCGHWRDDVALWSHDLAVNETSIIAHGHLGTALAERGETGAALVHFNTVLNHKATPEAVNNVAWTLATASDPKFRNGTKAVEYAEKVCMPPRDSEPAWLDTLAAAYAEAGRYQAAVRTAKKAIELANANGHPTLAESIRSRLVLYEQGKPYHDDAK